MNLQEFRTQHPQYNDMPDADLVPALHKKFYADMPLEDFSKKIGYQPKESGGVLQTVTDTVVPGVLRGGKDIIDGGAQLITRGLEAVSPKGSSMETWSKGERERVEAMNTEGAVDFEKTHGAKPGIGISRMAGQILTTAPIAAVMPGAAAPSMAARIASGAATGTASGALQPVEEGESFWKEKSKQVGIGAGTGAVAAPVMSGLARLIQPRAATNPNIQTLLREGVTPTPGQIAGGAVKRVEDAATSIPFVGDVVRTGQRRAVTDLNRAAINRALQPIGQALPDDMPVGREAVEHAATRIGQAYDDLLPRLNVATDTRFGQEVNNVITGAVALPSNVSGTLQNIIRDRVLSRFNNGQMTGDVMKQVEGELGQLAKSYRSSAIASERELGNGVNEVQAALRRLVERSNPQHAGQLQAINSAYANLVRVEGAAGSAAAREGVFSPAQLSGAVRRADPSARKRQFAQGNARMQDLSDAANAVLPSSVPDSGTPLRLMTGAGMLAAPAYVDPLAGAGLAVLGSAYTPAGQRLMATLLARRPQAAGPAARSLLDYGIPAASLIAPPAAYSLLD